MTTQEPLILKRDRLGRIKHNPEQREALLKMYDTSALSAPEFSKQVGINYQTFATWIQNRKREQKRVSEPSSGWVEVVAQKPDVPQIVKGFGLEIDLGNGAKLMIRDESEAKLAAVLIRGLSC